MAVVTLDTTVLQVRPYLSAAAWNNVTFSGPTAQKSTTWGVTLKPGQATMALSAANEMRNTGGGTHDRLAQATANAVGLEFRDNGNLTTAQVAGGVTTNVLDRGITLGPALLTIVTTVGATPTATYQVEGSLDNSAWNPLSSADSATPTVFSTATFAITTATTTVRIIDPTVPWRYIRVTISAVTNVTSTIDAAVT